MRLTLDFLYDGSCGTHELLLFKNNVPYLVVHMEVL